MADGRPPSHPDELGRPPRGIRIEPQSVGLHIRRRWFSLDCLVPVVISLVLLGTLTYAAIASDGDMPLMQGLAPLIVLTVGIGMAYYGLAGLLNTTHLVIGGGKLSVRHRPVPWFGVRGIPTDCIEQLCGAEHSIPTGTGAATTYRLYALLTEGRKSNLLSGLRDSDQALFIESEIERHLGIEDRPVRGEIRKRPA